MDKEEHRLRIEANMRAAHVLNRKEDVRITPEVTNEIVFDHLIEEIAEIRAQQDGAQGSICTCNAFLPGDIDHEPSCPQYGEPD